MFLRRLYTEDMGYSDVGMPTKGDLSEEEFEKNQKPLVMFEDSQAAIYMSRTPTHRRTKHIDLKYHFIRSACEKGLVKLVKVESADQLADILTKPVTRGIFRHISAKLLKPRTEPLSGNKYKTQITNGNPDMTVNGG